jgi:hypothetical protein
MRLDKQFAPFVSGSGFPKTSTRARYGPGGLNPALAAPHFPASLFGDTHDASYVVVLTNNFEYAFTFAGFVVSIRGQLAVSVARGRPNRLRIYLFINMILGWHAFCLAGCRDQSIGSNLVAAFLQTSSP